MDARPPQPMASLGGLPPELKSQIVRELYFILIEQSKVDDEPWCEEMHDVYGFPQTNQLSNADDIPALLEAGWPHWGDYDKECAKYPIEPHPDDDPWQDERDPDQLYARRIPTVPELVVMRDRLRSMNESDFASLGRLALVNREFADLCYPFFWHNLDLDLHALDHLIKLVKVVLPRHAHHVKMIRFQQQEFGDYQAGFQQLAPGCTFEGEELLVQAEKWAGLDAWPNARARHRRARSLVTAKIIELCPNIEKIECESFMKQEFPDEDEEGEPPEDDHDPAVYRIDHALEAIATHLGPKLLDLDLVFQDDELSSEHDIAELLAACPNLLRVAVESYLGHPPSLHSTEVQSALLQMRSLKSLDVTQGAFINDAFVKRVLEYEQEDETEDGSAAGGGGERRLVRTNPFPALSMLALTECEDLSFKAFYALVNRFSATLKTLDLDEVPHANDADTTKKFLGKPLDLPHLEALVVSTAHDAKFLDAFVNCRLVEFCLGFCPAITYKDVEAFITLHQDSLKKVEIAQDAALSEADVESLEVLCYAKGIGCELLEDDESEDDFDEDGPIADDFDSDEEGEGGWYDEDEDEDDDASLDEDDVSQEDYPFF